MEEAARTLGQRLVVLDGGTDEKIEAAFAALAPQHVSALLVSSDPFFDTRRESLVALALQHRVPAIYQFREYAVAGGLISYGTKITEMSGWRASTLAANCLRARKAGPPAGDAQVNTVR